MSNGILSVPDPRNEPVLAYTPGSPERLALRAQMERMSKEVIEIAPLIDGRRAPTGHTAESAALEAHRTWSRMPWEHRAGVFLKAADLLAGPYRTVLNAATILGQSKTAYQAEIDSACELIDFWRFNLAYAEEIYRQQPRSSPGCWNYVDYRPLEGFVFAITPFNFTSIAGNLPHPNVAHASSGDLMPHHVLAQYAQVRHGTAPF